MHTVLVWVSDMEVQMETGYLTLVYNKVTEHWHVQTYNGLHVNRGTFHNKKLHSNNRMSEKTAARRQANLELLSGE